MDFSFPPPVEAFRAELRSWLAANLTDDIVTAARSGDSSDDERFERLRSWNRAMADAGFAAIAWPREYGGRGATVLEQVVFAEETIATGCPLPVNVLGMNNIAPSIMRFGTEDQKRTLLPRMLRADDVWCQGMSEPEAGSDLASLRCRALRDGDDFVVNGQKIWTSVAHRANWCALFVRTNLDAPKHKGISCLLLDMTLPGVEVRPLKTITGESDFNEMFFDDVRVPATALLGPLDEGWMVATTTLSHERAGAAQLYAMTRRKLHELVADLRSVGADGRPVLDDPVVQRTLGEIAIDTRYLELLCLRAVSADLHGGDATAQSSLAKLVWAELDQRIAALASEALGWDGLSGRWATNLLSSRSMTIAGGTTQINKNIVAQRVLGLPR